MLRTLGILTALLIALCMVAPTQAAPKDALKVHNAVLDADAFDSEEQLEQPVRPIKPARRQPKESAKAEVSIFYSVQPTSHSGISISYPLKPLSRGKTTIWLDVSASAYTLATKGKDGTNYDLKIAPVFSLSAALDGSTRYLIGYQPGQGIILGLRRAIFK